jgi:hypothetical protein
MHLISDEGEGVDLAHENAEAVCQTMLQKFGKPSHFTLSNG